MGWRKFDPTLFNSIQGHWQFEDDLTDDSGNGLTLTDDALGHAARYMTVGGMRGYYMSSTDPGTGSHLSRPSNDTELTILGALTIHAIVASWHIYEGTPDTFTLLSFTGGSSETEANNVLYNLYLANETGFGEIPIHYLHERDAGVNESVSMEVMFPYGAPHYVALTRDAAGTGLNLYVDGFLAHSKTMANATTGGTTSTFQIGRADAARAWIGSIAIEDAEASAADILAHWEYIQGGAIGGYRPRNTWWLMSAFETVLGNRVSWRSKGTPDFTGVKSPYTPGNLTGIAVAGRAVDE